MNRLTLCYSTHRPETLALTARILKDHDVIILDEPLHPDFHKALGGGVELEEHLLEVDSAYPVFTLGQYRLLQQFFKAGKEILQVEPYLDHLLSIQYFFAEEHRPDELLPNTPAHAVYRAERDATKNLIQYYQEVRRDDFPKILAAMNCFAWADARRFVLRDSLRAKRILELLVSGKDIYIEAGSIHLLHKRLLAKGLSREWRLQIHDIDGEAIKMLNLHGSLFSPGDELTLDYIFGRSVSRKKWQLYCAQSLFTFWLPFTVCQCRHLDFWSWRIGSYGATGHKLIETSDRSAILCFDMPWWAAAYLPLCWLALIRIGKIAAAD